jgi:hypothetical protein
VRRPHTHERDEIHGWSSAGRERRSRRERRAVRHE